MEQRANRLASALRWWHALSGEEKRTLRQMRIGRKLEAMQGARKLSDWELVNPADPVVYRHRAVACGLLISSWFFFPAPRSADLLRCKDLSPRLGKPAAAEPVKPPPFVEFRHDYPQRLMDFTLVTTRLLSRATNLMSTATLTCFRSW